MRIRLERWDNFFCAFVQFCTFSCSWLPGVALHLLELSQGQTQLGCSMMAKIPDGNRSARTCVCMGVFGSWCDEIWTSWIQTDERLEHILRWWILVWPVWPEDLSVKCVAVKWTPPKAGKLVESLSQRGIIINGEQKDATYGASYLCVDIRIICIRIPLHILCIY